MFHWKLIELESELLAKEASEKGINKLTNDCLFLLDYIQAEVGVHLGDKVHKDWHGWLTYLHRNNHRGIQVNHQNDSLIICRGRAFHETGMFAHWRAGFDIPHGFDAASEYMRGFDVTPAQDLDHLLLNFGEREDTKVFLWYGENIAAYKLIYEATVSPSPHEELKEIVAQACVWILTRPKNQTLSDFLKEKATL